MHTCPIAFKIFIHPQGSLLMLPKYLLKPELQQMTFSSYNNKNTYKQSPLEVRLFLYLAFIQGQSPIKSLPKRVDCYISLKVVIHRGFDIQDELTPLGIRLNIPPFFKGKTQLEKEELVET